MIYLFAGMLRGNSLTVVFVNFWFAYDYNSNCVSLLLSRVARKPVFGVVDQVQHKQGLTATEDGKRLEILNEGSKSIVLSL